MYSLSKCNTALTNVAAAKDIKHSQIDIIVSLTFLWIKYKKYLGVKPNPPIKPAQRSLIISP